MKNSICWTFYSINFYLNFFFCVDGVRMGTTSDEQSGDDDKNLSLYHSLVVNKISYLKHSLFKILYFKLLLKTNILTIRQVLLVSKHKN